MANFTTAILGHTSTWPCRYNVAVAINGFPATVPLQLNQGYELHFTRRNRAGKGWQARQTFQAIGAFVKTQLSYTTQSRNNVKKWLSLNF